MGIRMKPSLSCPERRCPLWGIRAMPAFLFEACKLMADIQAGSTYNALLACGVA
jgi:hypothetical protein